MEKITANLFKASFCFPDFKITNKFDLIKFDSFFDKSFFIEKEKMQVIINLDESNDSIKSINVKIYLMSKNGELPKKEFIITLFGDIDNKFTMNINDEGDCSLEIISMWDVDYDDYDDDTIIKEREIPDIVYDGKKIENYEKLYERKRWNFLNVNIEKFEKYIFSQETFDYIKKNKNKSYKYDILLCKEKKMKLLSEKVVCDKVELLDEKDKEILRQNITSLNSKLIDKIEDLEKSTKPSDIKIKKENLNRFWNDNKLDYSNIEETFQIYNKKWNLNNFSDNDMNLYLLFSEMRLYYYKNYEKTEMIPFDLRERTKPVFDKFKDSVIKNKSINLIDKARIINCFTRFCSTILYYFNFPELIILEELKDDDPLKIAREKFKNVIDNLKESSAIFKKLLLFNMGSTAIINEWDFRDYEVSNFEYVPSKDNFIHSSSAFNSFKNEFNEKKNKNYPKLTFPVLSMLTLEQVKNHCYDLLPKYIFKVPEIYNFKSVSMTGNRISFFNENRILNTIGMKKELLYLEPKSLVLPYMIEISHDTYSYLKVKYLNNNNDSPILNPMRERKKLICPNNYKPKSGYILEYFCAEDYNELLFLKFRNENLFPLTDSKYWVDINFNKMKKFGKTKMINSGINIHSLQEDFENMSFFNRRGFNEDLIMRCAFRKFNDIN